jgi:ribonuclease P protein component
VEHIPVNQRFPRQHRLTRASEFERVLRRPDKRLSAGPLRLNVVFTRMQHARLGLIVGKKSVARASARNRIKRVIRERFRQAQDRLPAADLVVRVVAPMSRAQLHRHLDRLVTELEGLEGAQT